MDLQELFGKPSLRLKRELEREAHMDAMDEALEMLGLIIIELSTLEELLIHAERAERRVTLAHFIKELEMIQQGEEQEVVGDPETTPVEDDLNIPDIDVDLDEDEAEDPEDEEDADEDSEAEDPDVA